PTYDPDKWTIDKRQMNIDGIAGTTTYSVDGNLERAGFLKYDVTNLAYFLADQQHAGIIGVGGGRDLLSAKVFGVPQVTGVEINPIFVRLWTEEAGFADFADVDGMNGVNVVV